eukprot:11207635-Lingulodinium_polyedra.AAC.1
MLRNVAATNARTQRCTTTRKRYATMYTRATTPRRETKRRQTQTSVRPTPCCLLRGRLRG